MHIYEMDGQYLPSVTTIIHSLGSDELMRWANAMGLYQHKKYDDIMERTSRFGTLVHSHLQSLVDPKHPEPIPYQNPSEQYDVEDTLRRFHKLMSKHKYKTIFSEKTIVSTELGYGGTMDWYVLFDNLYTLLDFKTGKNPQPHMFLQLGGYYNLLQTLPDFKLSQAGIINVNTNQAKLTLIGYEELQFYADAFTSLAEFYKKYEFAEAMRNLHHPNITPVHKEVV